MRLALGTVVLLAAAGCSMSAERYERIIRNCNDASVDCRPEAIRSRVTEAFRAIEVEEVVACTTEPAEFCGSTFDDEDACLVRLASPLAPASAEPNERATTGPRVVRQLLGATSDVYRLAVRGETPNRSGYDGYGPAKVLAYVSDDGTHAVLHLAEMRCENVDEII